MARVARWRPRRVRAGGPDAGAVVVRHQAGYLLIQVREEIGPAAEARLGRLLHGAIRPGGTGILVDLRHTAGLGASGASVLWLARTLAERHGVPLAFVHADEGGGAGLTRGG
ncbi:hypothetical protein [Streptomyces sp. CRN 30]|uniref:hypothetical protein n=1 Tax=Streptomyces sp. CRN 30 TaxID=3075613 RepID=UPI002A7FE717|nr:hypothetical protein [Streptomyces sp. CRN 30]